MKLEGRAEGPLTKNFMLHAHLLCQCKCLCMWFPLLAKGSNKIELTYISLRDVIKQVLFY